MDLHFSAGVATIVQDFTYVNGKVLDIRPLR
jgi:hypothetical protein